jgi:hypothetical protein
VGGIRSSSPSSEDAPPPKFKSLTRPEHEWPLTCTDMVIGRSSWCPVLSERARLFTSLWATDLPVVASPGAPDCCAGNGGAAADPVPREQRCGQADRHRGEYPQA